ncbi:MAG: radical SAM protein, partial [Bacillota bacterium]|nr:radical SAM protein [Bacillota bacterium]
DDRVYFRQSCPEHGDFETLASESSEDFKEWIQNPVINIPPQKSITKGDPEDGECPLHCGTCENHLQTTCCVLIDVTQRCNQHCPYCFAAAEIAEKTPDGRIPGELSLEEIEQKYDWLLQQGEEGREFNIQLSGGEPTMRDDLPEIIKMGRDKGFSYIQINSNGRRLAEEEGYALKLRQAGASVIFMQFDGTDDEIYMRLRGEALFEKKVQAIRNCERAGLAVTLVPTIVRGVNDKNIGKIMDFMVENVNVVKGVHFQPASFFGRYPEGDELEGRITMFGLLRELEAQRPQFKYEDSLPISTGHPLCCFYSTYIREPDGSIRCTLSQKQRKEGVSCCDTQGHEEVCCCEETATTDCCCCDGTETDSCCCGEGEPSRGVVSIGCCDMTQADQLEVIKKDRDYVLNKWDIAIPDEDCDWSMYKSADEITDLDEFLTYYKRNTFTVTGMAFQDITNLDAERLKRCRVVQLTDDNRLIPFCAYNTLYRGEI